MKLMVVDGNSIINRAYYGVRPLTTKEGLFTNAVYGFATILLRLLAETQPDGVAVAFDVSKHTFRNDKYAGYKAGRHAMPEELAMQLPLVKDMIRLWGFAVVEAPGFEADDILGTLSAACRERPEDSCVIATGDRDSLQLVGEGVTVRLAKTQAGRPETVLYDEAAIRAQYGVSPRQLIEVKAIMGDASDKIPGVPGIGEKGALSLISQFGTLDGVYAHLDSPDIKPGMRKKLEEGRESAYLSRELAEIVTDVPIPCAPEDYKTGPMDREGMTRLLTRLEMFSLIPRIVEAAPQQETAAPALPPLAPAPLDLEALLTAAAQAGTLYFTCGAGRLYACAGEAVAETGDGAALLAAAAERGLRLVTDDTKEACRLTRAARGVAFDVTLAAYLLNPSATAYDSARLCAEYGVAPREAAGFTDDARAAACAALPALEAALAPKIEENGQSSLLHDMEIPLAGVLQEMEDLGFAVDREGLERFGRELAAVLAETEQEIYALAGEAFNINSPKQLGEVLFTKLGLPARKKTAKGYSTDAAVLEELRDAHPIVERILTYRQNAKLKSTYCDGLLRAVAPDGRLHSRFNQTETRTGRISSTEPNLQNIPVRSELGRELRRFFLPREGWVLVDADYSQIELRVLAHISEDEAMCRAFRENADIHTRTAAEVMGLPEEMVTREMRSAAKAVNFGILYGISAFSLAKDLHIPRRQAEEYIEKYMRTYRGIAAYMERTIAEAKENGYVTTIFGRRRLLPELSASNFNTRSFGQRVARNMPIQGAAADIIKLAMIRVRDRLEKESMRTRLILQVHDELILEAPPEEQARAAALLREEMENVYPMRVPLSVEVTTGDSWYACK